MRPVAIIAALGGAALMLAASALMRLSQPTDEGLPDTEESRTQWLCRADGHAFSLTALRAEQARVDARRAMPVYCPKCSAADGWRAARCTRHNRLYLTADAPQSTGRCPECYPDLPKGALPGDGAVLTPQQRERPKPPPILDENGLPVLPKAGAAGRDGDAEESDALRGGAPKKRKRVPAY